MSERPTFSPFWHRVRLMRPRLRPHVQITRQLYRGRRWHVVHDPASNQFYRLNPIAHQFVASLDGKRDVETAWKLSLATFGDSAPTQNEIIQLLSQLYSSNLLSVDDSPETEQLLRRGRERVRKRIQQQAIGIMYFRIRLFNPDRLLAWLEPVFRPLLNRWGLLAWALFVGWAVASVLPQWERLTEGFDTAISPANWPWLIVVFVVTKAIHELGHGIICKRFGGQVPEMGVMMLVMFPAPYVDASAAWGFASRWQRMAVGAGGMIFELTIAAAAALYWVGGGPGELATQLAYNAMLTASVSTVLFNANPLMRFDGYYILADLLEVPNLMQRAQSMLKYLMQKHVYRLKRATPPSTIRSEQGILVVYGIAALAYRIFLFISITLFVMGKMFALGLVLAVWTAAAWFIIPVGGFVHWLAAGPALAESRGRAVLTSLVLLAAGVLLLGVIPMPDHRRSTGIVESESHFGVFAGSDGFLAAVHKRPGDAVARGEPIVTMESPELEQKLVQVHSALDEVRTEERRALNQKQPAAARAAQQRLEVFEANLAQIRERIAALVVRAPCDGVVAGEDPSRRVGAYLRRGEPICQVLDPAQLRVAASIDQANAAWLFDPRAGPEEVRLRPRSRGRGLHETEDVAGGNLRMAPAGRQELPGAALGYLGGGQIDVDPQQGEGAISKRPRFTVYIDPAGGPDRGVAALGYPGERVRVRFTLPDKPLAAQWLDRLARIVQGRVNI
ncbi:MAG TPA: PqqD family peptide modification chaperone [Phycisphaerales bacterium]|nr:PqqD family peptide modification chaperone [Phycisphaerales bacterium]